MEQNSDIRQDKRVRDLCTFHVLVNFVAFGISYLSIIFNMLLKTATRPMTFALCRGCFEEKYFLRKFDE